MFEFLGNTPTDFMRCPSRNFPIKLFSLQQKTQAEVAKSDRRLYLFFSHRFWHSILPHGCVPIKRLTVVSLACLLSTCESGLAEIRQDNIDKVADFPGAPADLSGCVHRALEAMGSSYAHRLHAHPDKPEFFITTTPVSEVITRAQRAGLELRFVAHGQGTTVEMREGVTGGWVLARKVWPFIERCSQQIAAPPAASLPAP
jgi:hypothetical protein